jgi:lysylphosphatidylglycerol synthetase-like protein (DUF2156 family)
MRYQTILGLALVPTTLLFLLSLISVVLTMHYWILGDWFLPRGVQVTTGIFDDRSQSYPTDYTIVYFQDRETDATIASGVLSLSAAVVALIAWIVLRKSAMDAHIFTVSDVHYPAFALWLMAVQNKRRFWVLAVVVMTISSAIAALASLVQHYTKKGSDEYGCSTETLSKCRDARRTQYSC